MGREPVQVKACLQRPWRHGLHPDPSWTPQQNGYHGPANLVLLKSALPCAALRSTTQRTRLLRHAMSARNHLDLALAGFLVQQACIDQPTDRGRAVIAGKMARGFKSRENNGSCGAARATRASPGQCKPGRGKSQDQGRARSEEPIRYCTTDMFEAKKKAEEKGRRGPWSYR
ncbi:hypothetical protein MRS44_010415 [Fusarium solani]|nr:hypothetical protein MRS44_010415 [Fusarium solani]